MKSFRFPLAVVAAALFAFASGSAWACPGQEGGCACAKAAEAAGAPGDAAAPSCAGHEEKAAAGSCAGHDGQQADGAKAAGSCAGHDEKAAAGSCAGHDQKACACDHDKDGKCGCGAGCAANHGGKCEHAAGAAEGGCGGCAACAAAAAAAKGAPVGEKLKAVIDPATGKLVEPADDEPTDEGNADMASEAATGSLAKEVQQPGGGVMVAAPQNAMPKAVATIDGKGKANTGCAE